MKLVPDALPHTHTHTIGPVTHTSYDFIQHRTQTARRFASCCALRDDLQQPLEDTVPKWEETCSVLDSSFQTSELGSWEAKHSTEDSHPPPALLPDLPRLHFAISSFFWWCSHSKHANEIAEPCKVYWNSLVPVDSLCSHVTHPVSSALRVWICNWCLLSQEGLVWRASQSHRLQAPPTAGVWRRVAALHFTTQNENKMCRKIFFYYYFHH